MTIDSNICKLSQFLFNLQTNSIYSNFSKYLYLSNWWISKYKILNTDIASKNLIFIQRYKKYNFLR